MFTVQKNIYCSDYEKKTKTVHCSLFTVHPQNAAIQKCRSVCLQRRSQPIPPHQSTSTRRFTAFNSHSILASTSSSRNHHQPPSVTIIVAHATVTNQHRQQPQPQHVAHTSNSRSSSAAAHQPAHPLPAIGKSDLQQPPLRATRIPQSHTQLLSPQQIRLQPLVPSSGTSNNNTFTDSFSPGDASTVVSQISSHASSPTTARRKLSEED